MNDYLTGSNTNLGNALRHVLERAGGSTVHGNSLVLTLRPGVQRLAQQLLGTRCGAVVAMNPRTGAVYVMASSPTYDPNLIDKPGGYAKVLKIRGDCGGASSALLNRATAGLFTPGSTFKIVTAAAALDSGTFTPTSSFDDPGYCTEYGQKVSNAGNPDQNGPEAYGRVDLAQGFEHSINSVFCNVGKQLGAKTILDYAKRFGFYRTPPLETPGDERAPSGMYKHPARQPEATPRRGRPGSPGLRAVDDARDAAPDGDGRLDRRQQGRRPEAVPGAEDRRARRLDRPQGAPLRPRPRDQAARPRPS